MGPAAWIRPRRCAARATMEPVGVSFAVLAYSNQQCIDVTHRVDDRTARDEIVRCLFPGTPLVPSGTVSLLEIGIRERGVVAAASFEQGVLAATRGAHRYIPSKLHSRYLKPTTHRTVQLFTQRSFNDMFAYARWSHGRLVRSVSINPVGKVWESLGLGDGTEVDSRSRLRTPAGMAVVVGRWPRPGASRIRTPKQDDARSESDSTTTRQVSIPQAGFGGEPGRAA